MNFSAREPVFFPFYRTERYPSGLTIDFRKLEHRSLRNYVKHHGINVRPDSTQAELAIACGRHFEDMKVSESGVIGNFMHKYRNYTPPPQPEADELDAALDANEDAFDEPPAPAYKVVSSSATKKMKAKTKQKNAVAAAAAKREEAANLAGGRKRRAASSQPTHYGAAAKAMRARNGEEVAVYDESDARWILARVNKYYADLDEYECTDEDPEEHASMTVPACNLHRLEDSAKGLEKNDEVLAVFPDTTSFYAAVIHKITRIGAASNYAGAQGGGSSGSERGTGKRDVPEIIVKFCDDEDSITGSTPLRRLPARHVMKAPREGPTVERSSKNTASSSTSNGASNGTTNGNSQQHFHAGPVHKRALSPPNSADSAGSYLEYGPYEEVTGPRKAKRHRQ